MVENLDHDASAHVLLEMDSGIEILLTDTSLQVKEQETSWVDISGDELPSFVQADAIRSNPGNITIAYVTNEGRIDLIKLNIIYSDHLETKTDLILLGLFSILSLILIVGINREIYTD